MRRSLISCLLVSAAAFAFPACGDDDPTDGDGEQGGASGANTGGGTQTTGGTSGGGGRGGTGGGGRGGGGGDAPGDAGAGVGGNPTTTGGTNAGGVGGGAGDEGVGGTVTDAGAGGTTGGTTGTAGAPDGEAGEIGIGGAAGAESGVAGAGGGDNLSDDQVAQVVRAANLGEIAMAEVALERAVDPAVQEYAQEMIAEHTTANQALAILATSEMLAFVPSEVSQRLTREATAIVTWLEVTPIELFDLSYMTSQVATHAETLRIIDEVLLPSAEDPELEAFLTNLRPVVVEHLEHARTILESLQ